MQRRALTAWLLFIGLTACDEPAPIVLGRLQPHAGDAGEQPEADAAHEHENPHGNEHEEDDAREADAEHR